MPTVSRTKPKRYRKNDTEYFQSLDQLINKLFEEAAAKKWEWKDLARKAGISESTVNNLGDRKTNYPEYRTVALLAKALGGSIVFNNKPIASSVVKIRWEKPKKKTKSKAARKKAA